MPTYRPRFLLVIALCAAVVLLTAGCGNKGDLVRPSDQSAKNTGTE